MFSVFPQTKSDIPVISFLSDDEAKKLRLANLQTLCKNYNAAAETLVDFQLTYDECAFFRHQRKHFPAAHLDNIKASKMEKLVTWYGQAQHYLSFKDHRDSWQQYPTNKDFSNTLTDWEAHGALADYSVAALVALQHHLDEMNDYLNKALLELHQAWKRSFYQPFRKHLTREQYLTAQRALVRELQHHKLRQYIILNAMVARLQAASLSYDIANDDILWWTFATAKKQGKLPADYVLPHKPRYGLDKKSFFFFHQTILQRGNQSQRKALFKCEWYQSNSKDAIPLHLIKNEPFPTPVHLQHPLTPELKSELFYQAANINGLFKRAKEELYTPINLQNASTHPLMKQLATCEEHIQKLSTQLQKEIKTGFSALIYFKKNRAIRQFQQQLANVVSETITQTYLDFIEQLHTQLKSKLETKQSFSALEATRTMSLLLTLESSVNHTHYRDAYKKLERKIHKTLEKLVQTRKQQHNENLFTQGLATFERGQLEEKNLPQTETALTSSTLPTSSCRWFKAQKPEFKLTVTPSVTLTSH